MRRSCAGRGSSAWPHTTKILRLSEDLPIIVEIVDRAERIEELLPHLDEMVGEGMMTLEKVQIIAYRHGKQATLRQK
jgi:PII-like signaling protein